MTDLDPYQSVEGRYIKIIALLPENDSCMFASYAYSRDSSDVLNFRTYFIYTCFRNLIAAGINETNIRSARK